VYAARGDFSTAERVLDAGERNAVDMLPVYHGVTQMLARRRATRFEEFVGPLPPPRAPDEEATEGP
jgi:hypothetical protein